MYIFIAETGLELIQLPDDELDTFPSLEIRTYSQRNHIDDIGDEDMKLAIENFHKHPLILVGDEAEHHNYNCDCKLVCDICTQTITILSQFYRCAQQTGGCNFLAHKVCADLLPILKFAITPRVQYHNPQPCPNPPKWFSGIFYCLFCYLPSNGLCYSHFFPSSIGFPLTFDLACIATQ